MAKNSTKTHEPVQKSTASNRSNKALKDAKQIAIGISSIREGNITYCKICKDSGSLIMCGHCTRSFHLQCALMLEPDIPAGIWYCMYCVPHMEKKLKDEFIKQEKSERQIKEGKIKTCLGQLNNAQKDITVKYFEKKHPEFVKQGKLQYPIEDSLLKIEAELYQTPLPAALPLPQNLPYEQEIISDMLFIVDFVYTFQQMLKITPFNVDQLVFSLNSKTQNSLIKEIHMSLIELLVKHILTRENSYEGLNEDSRYLYSAAQLSEIFDVTDCLPYS